MRGFNQRKFRRILFTINFDEGSDPFQLMDEDLAPYFSFVTWQLEVGGANNVLHLQGYGELTLQTSGSRLHTISGP